MIDITYDARCELPVDEILDFQGDAKTITQDNLDKLKRSIRKHGFFVPMFVWKKATNSKTYIIDGHQRLKALQQIRDEDGAVPDIPVEYIQAKSRQDAAEKLLAVTSQFGSFDIEALENWTMLLHINLPLLDVRLVDYELPLVELDLEIPETNQIIDEDELAKTSNECPSCGFTW